MFFGKPKPIPEFETYYASTSDMNKQQLRFYRKVEVCLKNGTHIRVDGNVSYIFVYINKLMMNWDSLGFEGLSEYLIYISELYIYEKKLSDYCLYWARDCLLGLGRYEEYLEKSEPVYITGTSTHSSNLRLNVQNYIGVKANPIDLLLMAGGRKTKFIEENQGIYKSEVIEALEAYASQNETWFEIMKASVSNANTYKSTLFSGAPISNKPSLAFETKAYYSDRKTLNLVKQLARDAESSAREKLGLPRIGEGWLSETQLFNTLKNKFPQTKVIQHGRPKWLGRQHYDIWLPHWKIAVEYHGLQHFKPVEFFGGKEAYEKTVQRDQRKVRLSKKNGVKLFVVRENYNENLLIEAIESEASKRDITPPKVKGA